MLNTERLCMGCMNDNGGEKICPICGYDSSVPNPEDCLPVGFRLNKRFLVGKENSRNGEGVTYIGWDIKGDSIVYIKEYYPSGFAGRNADKSVSINRGGEYTFNEGLMQFIEINRCIMESELPSLVPVVSVFEENGTVYTVYRNISSISMREFLNKNGGALKWEQARPLFLPLIDTVKGMNDIGIVHAGISIDTVLVGRDGKLRISGYAISKLRNTENEIEAEVFPGFSAVEQYEEDSGKTDEYTDVYGLCATLFRVLIGTAPPEAPARLQNDSMTIPAKFAEELPRHVLSAMANGLQVKPEDRTKTVEAFKNELVYGETADAPAVKRKNSAAEPKENVQSRKKSGGSVKYVIISSACTAVVFLAVVTILVFTVFKDSVFKKKTSSASASDISSSAPTVESIGTVDSNAAESAVLYPMPKFTGKYYAEIIDNEEYDKFKFTIKTKVFDDKFTKGQICVQSVAPGTNVARDTAVELTISLGPKEIKIANVLGLDEANAKIELLKQGFLYDNIQVLEKYDEDHQPKTVLEQEPKYGSQVNTDIPITIYINSYEGADTSSQSSGSTSQISDSGTDR